MVSKALTTWDQGPDPEASGRDAEKACSGGLAAGMS